MSASPLPAPIDTAVLLVNLGTPAAPTTAAVRRFLAEFLHDHRVIEMSRWIWCPILHGVILRVRPARSAHAYQSVWTPQGSPLMVYSRALAAALQSEFDTSGARVRVALAMRYGEPSISKTIAELRQQGVRRLLVLPLYPQYSAASTGSAFDGATKALQAMRWPPELRVINDYHDDSNYLEALAASVQSYWNTHGRAERLMLSFHGLPQRCVDAGDPYFDQCRTTARLLREKLGLSEDEMPVTFQSRVGREPWLKPYTDEILRDWPAAGVRRVQVLCPGFAVDCLETLEEIALRNRADFLQAGGERLDYIPALNADVAHARALAALVQRHTQGWPALFTGTGIPSAGA
jgi:protoporphyrin/coproporphyrin ferrochelatase